MKKKNVQQEVLVLTQTSFAQKALIRHNGSNKKSSSAEELEEGFWNGLLDEMLPELMAPMQGWRAQYSLWQISTGEFLMLINMGETLDIVEESHSINPNACLSIHRMN